MAKTGRSPLRGSGLRPFGVEPPEASQAEPLVPNADEGESYRLNPAFRRFLGAVGSVERAMAAWEIAREEFAPVADEAEFEVWQGDEMVAGCSGPRSRAMAEAVRYAVVYQADDAPCVIQEVVRRGVSPDQAHAIIAQGIEAQRAATVEQGAVHESPVGATSADAPNINSPPPPPAEKKS